MRWIHIAVDSIPEGNGIRKIRVAGKTICLISYSGALYATSLRCPHAGADLSRGWCEEGRLICPYHRRAFDLRTGRGDAGQGDYVRVYPLEQREDGWYIGVKESWIRKLFSS